MQMSISIGICILFTLVFLSNSVVAAKSKEDSSQDDFIKYRAAKKLKYLWNELNQDTSPETWMPDAKVMGLFIERMTPSMDHTEDFMPEGREKLIHPVSVNMIILSYWL